MSIETVQALSRRVTPVALALCVALAIASPSRAADPAADSSKVETPAPPPAPSPVPAVELAPAPAKVEAPAPAPAPKKEKAPRPPRDLSDPWDRGATWLSVRVGYAKARYDGAAPANIGGGFGFSHMFFKSWSLGGYAQYDILGRFQNATESEMPFTLEAARHFKWGSSFHPYLGAGGGVYYHKTYRTGMDLSHPRGGGYLLLGANAPVSAHGLLGIDFRGGPVARQDGDLNPVFLHEKRSSNHLSLKLNWSYTY